MKVVLNLLIACSLCLLAASQFLAAPEPAAAQYEPESACGGYPPGPDCFCCESCNCWVCGEEAAP